MKHLLWFDKWSEEYMEGLPTGNGRLAAMMLGQPEKLRIALNHDGCGAARIATGISRMCRTICKKFGMPCCRMIS